MGRKKTPGLYKREEIWHIDKRIRGTRLCESTGTRDLAEAEAYLARRSEDVRQAKVYGVRPSRSFREAATRFLKENGHKRSLVDDAMHLKQLDPFIGHLPIASVHTGTLQGFIDARKAKGIKSKSINLALSVVRRILNLAAAEWLDESNLTWFGAPAQDQAAAGHGCAQALSAVVGRAGAVVSGTPGTPRADGVVQGEHRMPGKRGLPAQMALGSVFPGIQYFGFYYSRRAGQEWRRPIGCLKPGGQVGDRRCKRTASGVCLLVQGQTFSEDKQYRMESGAVTGGTAASPGA